MGQQPVGRNGLGRWVIAAGTAVVLLGTPLVSARAGEVSLPVNIPSERGVTPIVLDVGDASPLNECRTLTGLEEISALQVPDEEGELPPGSTYTDTALEVAIDGWDPVARSFGWTSNLPVLAVWVKGESGGEGNAYDYAAYSDVAPEIGADHDADLHTKPNPAGPAGLSHVTFCYAAPFAGTPDLVIDKTSDADGLLRVGDRYRYSVVVTNVGGATAHRIQLSDDLPTGLRVLTLLPDFDGGPCTVASSVRPGGRFAMSVTCRRSTLAAGTSASITFDVQVTADARCGSAKNIATVTADDEPPDAVDRRNTAAHVDEIACPPSIALEKSGPELAHVGDVAYRFLVTNDGETDLFDVRLRDRGCDAPPVRTAGGDGDDVLASHEEWGYRCAHTIARADGDPVKNVAVVTATDGATRVSNVASHRIDVIDPAIELRTTVDPPSGHVGDTLTFVFVVTNTGDTPLIDIVVTDDVLGAIGTIGKLGPGGRARLTGAYVLPSTDIHVVHVSTASGTDALGKVVSGEDTATISIVAGQDDANDGSGGTAFTGPDTGGPASAAAVLLVLGLGALVASRRRSPIRP